MQMFFVAGISLALFITFLLISKRRKSTSDRILAGWMVLILANLVLYSLLFSGFSFEHPFLLGMEQPLPLLHGVFLYWYVASLTGQLPVRTVVRAAHLLPAIVTYAGVFSFFLLPSEQKILVYRHRGEGYDWFIMVKWYAMTAVGVSYVGLSLLLLARHRTNIRERFSDIERVQLTWLRLLTYGLGVIWILVMLFRNDVLTYSGAVLFVFLIGFFGVRQGEIFRNGAVVPDQEEEKKKYPRSGLSEEAAATLHASLKQMMDGKAPYMRSDLSIDDLAGMLGVHPNALSQVINQLERKNFYDFVNGYRVEEFKRRIALPAHRHLTLLSVAYDCGFNSKSSFNRAFKKAVGSTPSRYFSELTSPR